MPCTPRTLVTRGARLERVMQRRNSHASRYRPYMQAMVWPAVRRRWASERWPVQYGCHRCTHAKHLPAPCTGAPTLSLRSSTPSWKPLLAEFTSRRTSAGARLICCSMSSTVLRTPASCCSTRGVGAAWGQVWGPHGDRRGRHAGAVQEWRRSVANRHRACTGARGTVVANELLGTTS